MFTAFPVSGTAAVPEILPAATPHDPRIEVIAHDPLEGAFDLPCTLTLEIPVVHFTVGCLAGLRVGSVVRSGSHQNEDLPLHVNGQLVGLVEIEVVGDSLAVRLTGIA